MISSFTADQQRHLRWLIEKGGSGYIDRYGRVVAGGEVRNQGTFVSWLKLLSYGHIAGSNDRIFVTDLGYAACGIHDRDKAA